MYTMNTFQVDTNDYDYNTESDLTEQVLMEFGEFASGVGAEVEIAIESISFRHESVTVGVAGADVEVGLFTRRWYDE